METLDLWVYKELGKIGSQVTGYRCVSTYHDFTYFPKQVTTGAFDDYMYDHFGAFAFTIELWDLPSEAGIKDRKFIEWYRDHPHEQDLQILQWLDEHAPAGYVDWYPFDHPQLGKVELGGFDFMYTWRNPPHAFLQAEVERNLPYTLRLGDLLPRLAIFHLELKPLSEGLYHLNLVVDNTGYLPTFTSEQSKKRKAIRPVRAELELPDGVEIVDGKRKIELGHLAGRSTKFDTTIAGAEGDTDHRAHVEWTLRAKSGDEITVKVLSERAGNIRKTISVP
jgi:murein tripeptide amidase MpaA